MKKDQFIKNVATDADLSSTDAKKAVDAVLENLQKLLANKDSIIFPGFGSFKTSERAARKGRNPQTGKEIDIPASTVAGFKAGNGLKEAMNK